MDVIDCITSRRSIRRYDSRKPDLETMLSVIEAGTYAPSAGNLQDWKFILVDDKELLKKISETAIGQECIHNAAFIVVICSDPGQTERFYGLRGVRLYTIQNCAAAAQNMLLAAHALGLGGAWVGAFDEDRVRSIVSMPATARPQAILCFGYPAESPDHKSIKDLRSLTYFNAYGSTLRNAHRVLKDYSRDVQKIFGGAKTNTSKAAVTTGQRIRTWGEKAHHKGKEFLKRYQPRK